MPAVSGDGGAAMRCPQCGYEAASSAAFCSRCGYRVAVPLPGAQREFNLMRVHISWWCFVPQLVVAGLAAAAGPAIALTNHARWPAFPALWLFAILLVLAAILRRSATRWNLTSERLVERRGLLALRRRELELADIRSVEVDQRLAQRLIGLGDVTVASAASADAAIRLMQVRNPQAVAEQIRQARLRRVR